jgi:periplasmic copper chaperone A
MIKYIALGLMLFAGAAWSQVEVEQPWIRATPPGAKTAAGYMTIRNKSAQPDRLVGGSSPMAAKVQTHVHIRDGEILRMREVKSYDIPAKGTFELKPGGAHLMLVDLKRPLKEGEKVPLLLKFEKSGELKVDFEVRPLAAPAPSEHKH